VVYRIGQYHHEDDWYEAEWPDLNSPPARASARSP
jgi:hypothetical protein